MTSSIQKALTGAALAAAITHGGFPSAHAQLIQPYGPFSEEPAVIIPPSIIAASAAPVSVF